jgi:hypothetical protein
MLKRPLKKKESKNPGRKPVTAFLLGFLTHGDGPDMLSRTVGKELPVFSTQQPRTAQFSSSDYFPIKHCLLRRVRKIAESGS